MGSAFERGLRLLRLALWFALWFAASALIAIWSPPVSLLFLATGGALFFWARKRGVLGLLPEGVQEANDPVATERHARYLVTQILRELTRVQVAFLCQKFATPKEGRTWLKRTLPRSYRPSIGEMHERLERARAGSPEPSLDLAMEVMGKRDHLLRQIDALEQAHRDHPTHTVANPVVFVVTENLSGDVDAANNPLVITLASWNPTEPTLLPQVDALTFFSEADGGRQIRGQAEFQLIQTALNGKLEQVSRDPAVFAVQPVGDPVKGGVRLSKVPLGFIIGAAELI
jgi:hypothetical protein